MPTILVQKGVLEGDEASRTNPSAAVSFLPRGTYVQAWLAFKSSYSYRIGVWQVESNLQSPVGAI